MKRILASGAALAALCAAATGAHAQAIEGVYVGADVGYSWTNGISGKSNVVSPAGGNYEWKFDREDTLHFMRSLGGCRVIEVAP